MRHETDLEATIAAIRPPDEAAAAAAARALDEKTKPPGSLGRLEELACRIAAIRREVPARPLEPAIVVAVADHGVAANGVSAYPREVTSQMLSNLARGGAAVCVLAREVGSALVVVDVGVAGAEAIPGVRDDVVDGLSGTRDLSLETAMPRETAVAAIERGIALARELAHDGVGLIGLGEVGIGNTTAAGAVTAAVLGLDPAEVCGPGTGLDAAGVARKVAVVSAALRRHALPREDAEGVDVLAAVGGLEIAYLTGVLLGASAARIPILLDGCVTGAAALVASRLAPASIGSTIAATRSPEPAHAHALEALGLEPLLDLRLRLGEGTGAALAVPLVRAAVAILTEMATFGSAGVSGRTLAAPEARTPADA